jgi:multiple sugar transport system permease protein
MSVVTRARGASESPSGASAPTGSGRSPLARRDARSGYLFVLPVALTLGLLVVYPLLNGFVISFLNTNLVNRWIFVGLDYFVRALTDPAFLRSLAITLLYAVLVVAGTLVVGTWLALLLNRELRFRWLIRAVLILPWLFPEVVVALLWKWIFNPIYGLSNHILLSIGLVDAPVQWLDDPGTAFWSVVVASVWKGYPLVMILVLAGLQTIPKELYEAASIDGANGVQLFRHITLPGLAPILLVTVILETVWWFKHFTIVWLLTAGGPVDATNVVSIAIYRTAFQNFQFGRAAAAAVIVFAICLAISLVYRKLIRDDR